MRGRAASALAALLLAFGAPGSRAETLYVIEQLVVSVTSAPDSSGERVASIHSADHVEVLDRQGDEIHVHLANGTEGWVKASYLSPEPPLKVRLSERTAEMDKLKQDVTRLEAEVTAARGAARGKANDVGPNTSANQPAAASGTTPSGGDTPAADATAHDPSFFMTPPPAPARPIWHWLLSFTVVALGLGFALGWYTLDRRIRRKYGGLRIY